MKRLVSVLILIIVLISIGSFAEEVDSERLSPIEAYKDNYMVFGNSDDQVLVQLSMKIALISPYNIGLFFGYSQYMFWSLYDMSSPFRDINFNPEIFWKYKIDTYFNYIQVGFLEHMSNGREGDESRSINRSYIQFQLSTMTIVELGLNVKVFKLYRIDKNTNSDIEDYMGYYESKIFLKLNMKGDYTDKEEIYFKWNAGKGVTDFNKGSYEIGVQTRLLFKSFNPNLFVIYRSGYGTEGMIRYKDKDKSVRIGVLLGK